jgi:hypothetical protein
MVNDSGLVSDTGAQFCVSKEAPVKSYRSRKQARIYLHEKGIPIGANSLAQLATTGEGPPFRYFGRYAMYLEHDLDAWAEARLSTPVRQSIKTARADRIAPAERDPRLSPPTRTGRKYKPRRQALPEATARAAALAKREAAEQQELVAQSGA